MFHSGSFHTRMQFGNIFYSIVTNYFFKLGLEYHIRRKCACGVWLEYEVSLAASSFWNPYEPSTPGYFLTSQDIPVEFIIIFSFYLPHKIFYLLNYIVSKFVLYLYTSFLQASLSRTTFAF